MKQFGIGKKLLIGGIALVVIPLLVVGVFSINKSSDGLRTIAEERVLLAAQNLARMADMILEEEMKIVRQLATDEVIVKAAADVQTGNTGDPEWSAAINRKLATTGSALGSQYEVVFVLGKSGKVFGDNMSGKLKGLSLADRNYFQKALKGETNVGDVVKSKASGQPVMVVASPIRNPAGEILGVTGCALKIDFLVDSIVATKIGETGYPFMLDNKGLTVAHPNPDNILKTNLKTDIGGQMDGIVNPMINGESGVENYVFKGTPKIAGFAPVKIADWSLAVTQDEEEFIQAVNAIRNGILLVGTVFLLLAIGAVMIFSRSMSRPIKKAADVANAIAIGDLTQRMEYTSRDEVGSLATSLDKMTVSLEQKAGLAQQIAAGDLTADVTIASEKDSLGKALLQMVNNLNEVLGDVKNAAIQVAAGTTQVSDSSQSLSQGATEQASSLEEITSSVTELSSQTKTNAENASQANKLATDARNTAEQGNTHMQDMINAMSDISGSSKEIAKIIKAIDDIAFQTNLLALNAAVEAARAGKHGKGFAVVSQEVRNLARRSAKAAQETTELIESAVKNVENGTSIVNQTAEALSEIVNGATKVEDLVSEIAMASNEQAQGIAQINQGLAQVDQVTQSNTANAEETASAAEELSGQAMQMQELVSRFKLKGAGDRHLQAYTPPAPSAEMRVAEQKAPETGSWGKIEHKPSSQAPVQPSDVIALDDGEFGKY